MSYTTYTSKVSVPITYQWKCSKCGTVNRISTTIYTRGQTMSVGRKVSIQHQNSATSMAHSQMDSIIEPLFGKNCFFDRYRDLGLNHGCKQCSHKEPWAARNMDWLRYFIVKIGIIALIIDALLFGFGLLLLLFGENRSSAQRKIDISGELILLGIAALLVGGFFLYRYVSRQYGYKKDNKISKLPKSSLPILVMNEQPVIDFEAIEMAEAEQNKQKMEAKPNKEVSASISKETPVQRNLDYSQKEKSTNNNIPFSAADEIEKFKGLLDKGIITQEEFDAKKKQLLGL